MTESIASGRGAIDTLELHGCRGSHGRLVLLDRTAGLQHPHFISICDWAPRCTAMRQEFASSMAGPVATRDWTSQGLRILTISRFTLWFVGPRTSGQTSVRRVISRDVSGTVASWRGTFELLGMRLNLRAVGSWASGKAVILAGWFIEGSNRVLRGWHAVAWCRGVTRWNLITGSHWATRISSTAIVTCSWVRGVRVARIFGLNAGHPVSWVRTHGSVTGGVSVGVHVVGTPAVGCALATICRDVHSRRRKPGYRPDSRTPAEIDRLVCR